VTRTVYRYEFQERIALAQVEESIALAILAAEGVHGETQVRLDAGYYLDESRRTCVVDATTAVGETVARVFTGFLRREFGEEAFRVERVATDEPLPRRALHAAPGARR
jgi:hypothetical protein